MERACKYCGRICSFGIGYHEVCCPKRPSRAKETLQIWEAKPKARLEHIARKLDESLEITTIPNHKITVYSFSDGSTLTATGRGQNFWVKLEERTQ